MFTKAMLFAKAGACAPFVLMVLTACSTAASAQAPNPVSLSSVVKIAYQMAVGSGAGSAGGGSAVERSAQLLEDASQPNIYVRDPLESKPRHIAEGEHPTWSPDGLRLAYCVRRDPGDPGQIHIVGSDGKGNRRLPHLEGCYPEWSPTGKEIAVTVRPHGRSRIVIVDENGQVLHELGEGGLAHWSPDGKKLLIERSLPHLKSGASLWTMSADGTGEKEIMEDTSGVLEAAWLPAGDGVIFSSRREGGLAAIYTAGVDGTNVHKMAFDRSTHLLNPSLSPDGKTLVVDTSTPDAPVLQISVMAIDTVSHRSMILAPGNQGAVCWKPSNSPAADQ